MVARSKRGQQARTYFLKTEEKYLKMIQAPEVPLSAEDLLLQQVKEHIKRKKVLLQKPENFVGQLHNSLEKIHTVKTWKSLKGEKNESRKRVNQS